MDHRHPYDRLTPQVVLDAVDSLGMRCDGRMLQLNSYENRVFQLMREDGGAVVAKFYRPGRWRIEQIIEEHAFAAELFAAELPVVAPLPLAAAHLHAPTLAGIQAGDTRFAVAIYPSCGGHGPDLERPDTLQRLGRLIGRLHAVGERRAFVHRRALTPAVFGHDALQRLLAQQAIPPEHIGSWSAVCRSALASVDEVFARTPATALRLHGDCHPGNILWRDGGDGRGGDGPHVVDFDDAVSGPAIQDLWMLLSGDQQAMREQLLPLLSGYRQFRDFDIRELALIEALRTLRMVHHSAWIAERWTDPAFPVAFPWFDSPGYWGQQTTELREQIDAMAAPPIDPAGLG